MVRRIQIVGSQVLVFNAFVVCIARGASAQAFIPAPGEGTVSVSYPSVVTRGQHGVSGTWFPNAPQIAALSGDTTDTHALIWYVDYGVSERFAVHASLPYMQVRYDGPLPHTVGFNGQPSTLDDGTYHGSFQDFYFGSRFKLLQSPRFALTPFAEVIIPSHHYESLAQTAVGRDLRALVFGAAVGGFADQLLPGLHFQSRVSYAVVQQAVDIRPNRTAIDSALGFFVTPRLAVQFIQTFQLTHDGIDWVGPPEFLALHDGRRMNDEYGRNHDRLVRANALSVGAGVSFELSRKIGVFATFTKLAWGENIPPPRSVTVGMNWNFQLHSASRSNPNANPLPAFQ